MRITTTPESSGAGIHAFLYCLIEKIALTIRIVKNLKNGKFLVEDFEAIPYSSSLTPNEKILLLF